MSAMDVTPQLIEQIEFAEKFRGYDPDEVDEFLERAGTTIAALTNALSEARSASLDDARAEARSEVRSMLDEAVQRAERAEAQLREAAAAPAPVAPAPVAAGLSEDDEVAQSTSTLLLAKRTADAAIAEAREECQRMLADARGAAEREQAAARAESERIIAEARSSSNELLAKASARADEEYGAKRAQIVGEIGELESRKTSCAVQIVAAEERIEEYRRSLSTVHASLTAIVDDPTLLVVRPVDGFEARPVEAPPVEAPPVEVAHRVEFSDPAPAAAVASAPAPDTSTTSRDRLSIDSMPDDSPLRGATGVAAGASSFASTADLAASTESPASDDVVGANGASARSDAGGTAGIDWDRGDSYGSASSAADSAPLFADSGAAFGADDGGISFDGDARGERGAFTSDALVPEPDDQWPASGDAGPDAPARDTWGPGSWSELAAAEQVDAPLAGDDVFGASDEFDRSELFRDSFDGAFGEPDPAPAPEVGVAAGGAFRDGFPSGGLPVIGQDRYTRDLDEAVNSADEPKDDAMAAFFEGDDTRQSKRFGRRR